MPEYPPTLAYRNAATFGFIFGYWMFVALQGSLIVIIGYSKTFSAFVQKSPYYNRQRGIGGAEGLWV